MGKEQEKRRGHHALALLEDELMAEAFTNIREELRHRWEQSPIEDSAGREKLYLSVQMLEKVQSYLRDVLQTGRLAYEQEDNIRQF